LKQRPELCVRMIRASLRGWQYAIEHQDEAVDIVLNYDSSGMQNRSHQVMMMDEIAKLAQMPGRDMGYTDRTTVRQVIYVLRQSLLEEPLQPEDVYTNEFWDQAQNSYKVAQE
jgi:NitT/TauT family transport system substrate-binding protein